jgi:hypothetical protein
LLIETLATKFPVSGKDRDIPTTTLNWTLVVLPAGHDGRFNYGGGDGTTMDSAATAAAATDQRKQSIGDKREEQLLVTEEEKERKERRPIQKNHRSALARVRCLRGVHALSLDWPRTKPARI